MLCKFSFLRTSVSNCKLLNLCRRDSHDQENLYSRPLTCTPALATWFTCCGLVLIIGAILAVQQPLGVDKVRPGCFSPGCELYMQTNVYHGVLDPGSAFQQLPWLTRSGSVQHKTQVLQKQPFAKDSSSSLTHGATATPDSTRSLPPTKDDIEQNGKLSRGSLHSVESSARMEDVGQGGKPVHISLVNKQHRPEHESCDDASGTSDNQIVHRNVRPRGSTHHMSLSWLKKVLRLVTTPNWNVQTRQATGGGTIGTRQNPHAIRSYRLQQRLGVERRVQAYRSMDIEGLLQQAEPLSTFLALHVHMDQETCGVYKTWIFGWFKYLYGAVLCVTVITVAGLIARIALDPSWSISVPHEFVNCTLRFSGQVCARLTAFGVWCFPPPLKRALQPLIDQRYPLLVGTSTYLSGTLIVWLIYRVVCWSYASWSTDEAPVVRNAWGVLCCILLVIYCCFLTLLVCYACAAFVTITAVLVLLVGFPVSDETGDRALEAASGEIGPRSLSFWDLEPRSLGASASSLSQGSVYRLE